MALTKVSRELLNTSIVDNGNATAITIDSSENVGIGTTSPSKTLVINENDSECVAIIKSSDTGTAGLFLGGQTDEIKGGIVFNNSDNSLQLRGHNNAERMRIDSSGNVGIGTASPSSFAGNCTLALNKSGGARLGLNGSSRFFYMGCDSGSDRLEIGRRISSNTTDSPDFVLNGSGKVGIATTSPEYNLDVTAADNVTTTTALSVQNASRNYGLGLGAYTLTNRNIGGTATTVDYTFDIGRHAIFKTSNAERMRIDSSGNLLVGTTTTGATGGLALVPSASAGGGLIRWNRANTTGTTYATQFQNAGSTVGQIYYTNTTTSYATSSDQRLKENIADADDAGSKIDAIQVRKYDWKADGSHQDYGMIAQELVEVAPEAVSVPEDSEEMMGVDYSKLVPMLIKEIQSLRNRVAQLEE